MKTLSSAFADLLFFSRYFGGGAIYIRGTISVTLSLLASLLSHLTFSSLSRQKPCYLIPISSLTVYVFLGETHNLYDFMTTMQMMRLFTKGEYMVISVDWETYSSERAREYLWS